MLINSRVTHRPSHSVAHHIQREQVRERKREQGRQREVRRPMSRHRSSHNTTDTNPGSVPLAPDCHKSDNASQQDKGEGQTEKSKSHSNTALIRQQRGGTNSNLWTEKAFINTTRQTPQT